MKRKTAAVILIMILALSWSSCRTVKPVIDIEPEIIMPEIPEYPDNMGWEVVNNQFALPAEDFTRLRKWREDIETWFKKFRIAYPPPDS